jgi:hypothetical protein
VTRPRLVYLSGPITARDGVSVEENVTEALKVYLRCVQHGIPTICPHLSGIFPSAWTAVTYEQWMDFDFRMIAHCTDMVMLPMWRTSPGACREKAFAESIGVKVHQSWVEWAAEFAADGAKAMEGWDA